MPHSCSCADCVCCSTGLRQPPADYPSTVSVIPTTTKATISVYFRQLLKGKPHAEVSDLPPEEMLQEPDLVDLDEDDTDLDRSSKRQRRNSSSTEEGGDDDSNSETASDAEASEVDSEVEEAYAEPDQPAVPTPVRKVCIMRFVDDENTTSIRCDNSAICIVMMAVCEF